MSVINIDKAERWEAANGNVFEKMKMNRTMALENLGHAAQGYYDANVGLVQGIYNNDPNIFQKTGASYGNIAGALTTAVGTGLIGFASHTYHGKGIRGNLFGMRGSQRYANVWELGEGNYKGRHVIQGDGGFFEINNNTKITNGSPALAQDAQPLLAANATADNRAQFLKGAKRKIAYGNEGGNIKFKGSGFGGLTIFGLTMGLGMMVSYTVGKGLGFMGKIIDSVHQSYQQAKMPTYDTRFFQNRMTEQWDMTAQQQVGAAMSDFSNRMVSTARIMHSRG